MANPIATSLVQDMRASGCPILGPGHRRSQYDRGLTRSLAPTHTFPRLPVAARSSYCYYMSSRELKVARIGNSRGVRLPAKTLERYGIGESVIMEERSDGILLRPSHLTNAKLSWDDTAREMASSSEGWSEWEGTDADGLDTIPWKQVAERSAAYAAKRKK